MRIGVLGDLHYVRKASCDNAKRARQLTVYEKADTARYLLLHRDVLPRAYEQIAAQGLDFIICTGDVTQGTAATEDDHCAEMREALAAQTAFGAPVLYTLGTHDGMNNGAHGRPISDVWMPYMHEAVDRVCQMLGMDHESPQEGCWILKWRDTALVLLDYTRYQAEDGQDQAVKKLLGDAGWRHLLLFAHAPVEPLFRFGFSRAVYAKQLMKRLEQGDADALFCAHTHNQIASIHRTAIGSFAQLQSSLLAFPQRPALEIRGLLPMLCEADVGWSYQENTVPSWWVVTIENEECRADWHVLDKGVCGGLVLKRGSPEFSLRPTWKRVALHSEHRPASASLEFVGSEVAADVEWSLNGAQLAPPDVSSYFLRRQVEVSLDAIRARNELRLRLPKRPCCLGGFVLCVKTETGEMVRSDPTCYVTNSPAINEWGYDETIVRLVPSGEETTLWLEF